MSKTTLKSKYVQSRLRLTEERLHSLDKRLMTEGRVSNLITEAMDENDLQSASKIIDKLRALKGRGLSTLDKGIEQAETELNKYTSGGPLAKAWTKLKGKLGIDNPLVKVMTMANALEQGFRQLPMILKNSIGNENDLYKNANSSIAELVTDETKQKILIKNIMKAMTPAGVFGAFKKVPYVDMTALVPELLAVDIGVLAPMIKTFTSGVNTSNIANDMKSVALGSGSAETKAPSQEEPAKISSGTEPAKPATSTTGTSPTVPPGETPPKVDQESTKVDANQIKAIAAKVTKGTKRKLDPVIKLLNDLNAAGHLKA